MSFFYSQTEFLTFIRFLFVIFSSAPFIPFCNLVSFLFLTDFFVCVCICSLCFFFSLLFSLNPRGPEPSKCPYSAAPSSLSFLPVSRLASSPSATSRLRAPLVERVGLKAPTSSVIPFYILCRVAALCHGCAREITRWRLGEPAPRSFPAVSAPPLYVFTRSLWPLLVSSFSKSS